MKLPIVCASIGAILSGCASTLSEATATEAALCEAWGESLPTRSRQDTAQTRAEITQAYTAFAAACPAFVDLLPD